MPIFCRPISVCCHRRGETFGERLYFAAEDLFKCGFDSVCLIDSDSPTIPAENFTRAVELLSSPGIISSWDPATMVVTI